MSEKVYVVTAGEYSDRSIDRVFKSKELAEKYCKTMNWISGYYYLYNFVEYIISDEYCLNYDDIILCFEFLVYDDGEIDELYIGKYKDKNKIDNHIKKINDDFVIEVKIYKKINSLNIDIETIEEDTYRKLKDLSIELKYHLLNVSEDEHERRINIIEEYLKAKFNIGVDENVLDYDSINKE